MVPDWILNSPLKAGIQTMEAGGRLGLASREADLRERAQAASEDQHAAQLGLSYAELQQKQQQVNAQLAESLRQRNALEEYRKTEAAHRIAQEGLEQKKYDLSVIGQRLNERGMALKESQAEDRRRGLSGPVSGQPYTVEGRTIPGVSVLPGANGGFHVVTEKPLTTQNKALERDYLKAQAEAAAANELGEEIPMKAAAARLKVFKDAAEKQRATSLPDVPLAPDASSRKAGMAYRTPKGVFKWTGKGWESND